MTSTYFVCATAGDPPAGSLPMITETLGHAIADNLTIAGSIAERHYRRRVAPWQGLALRRIDAHGGAWQYLPPIARPGDAQS